MLWGCNISTEIGYTYSGARHNGNPNLGSVQSATIFAPDGDGGDNAYMNRAANLWLPDTPCTQARMPNINHFQLINDSAVLKMAAAAVLEAANNTSFCLSS